MKKALLSSLILAGVFALATGCDDSSKTDPAAQKAQEGAAQIKEAAEQKADEIKQDAKEAADKTEQKAAELKQNATEAAGDAKEKAGAVMADAKEKAAEIRDSADAKADELKKRLMPCWLMPKIKVKMPKKPRKKKPQS